VQPFTDILQVLPLLVQRSPKDFGWLRSRWSTELLSRIINQIFNLTLHSATLHRYLKRAGIAWCRAAPTLKIRDPLYEEKLLAIEQALSEAPAEDPVFYQDEVDIDLNPKIGADWMPKEQQKRIATPGRTRSIILQVHYIQVPGKSTTSVATVRLLIYLPAC